jgi:transcriptional regulator with XRE-family HTH domain
MATKSNPLKTARLKRGLTALEVAIRAGCTPDYIYKLERGAGHLPRLGLARRLASTLGVSVDVLFPGQGEQ